ncbi:MAG: HpcH/HpaI aldolase/citrate lyase family protein [Campylobacterota bacterium]|nr:HpcH/HpaI aldolase/citrate lyase family protein [Campylobacterota bacterium]
MLRVIDPIALGATLFVPATHKNLSDILKRTRLSHLRSLVIDTEDGLHVSELERAIALIQELLQSYEVSNLYLFIRPRNTQILKKLLHVRGIKKIDGFILAKFTCKSMYRYIELLKPYSFYIMPSIEGEELFNPEGMRLIKKELDTIKDQVLLIRFGAEDMLRQLGLKRSSKRALYDMLAPSLSMANLLHIFKTSGYEISAAVYPFYKDKEGFIAEVTRDLQEGFISKTVIHPSQIDGFESAYRVQKDDLKMAQKILSVKEKSIFGEDGVMGEVPTQSPWAQTILSREHYYGSTDT